jgi:hypothetical protein
LGSSSLAKDSSVSSVAFITTKKLVN